MSVFDGVQQATDVRKEEDFVRGQRKAPAPSDIYNLLIKAAWVSKSKNGATGINLHLETHGVDDPRIIKVTEWISTGTAKGCVTYYETDKKDAAGNVIGKEKVNLPGFSQMEQMAQLVVGKGITACATEKRVIKLYSKDANGEVPTEVDMLVELVGKGVCGCVLHQIQDRTAKNAQTGEYEPTGKTFETNVVDKYLSPKDRRTLSEQQNNAAADFQQAWLNKWKGQIDDQSTGAAAAGTAGLPGAAPTGAAPTGAQAPAAGEKLFG